MLSTVAAAMLTGMSKDVPLARRLQDPQARRQSFRSGIRAKVDATDRERRRCARVVSAVPCKLRRFALVRLVRGFKRGMVDVRRDGDLACCPRRRRRWAA